MAFRFGLLFVLGLSALFALSSQYDVEKMSPVGDTHPNKDSRIRCKSAPAFALAGALEVAYNKATGKKKAFSVQEVVDCFHKGCEKSRLEEIVDWLIVNDRLAHKDKYTEYKAKVFTCRAGTSPDGLVGFKVTGLTKITPDDFEAEIQSRGVVMACVDTTRGGCPSYDDSYRGGVIAGNSTRSYYHCMENVLITGFDDDSYTVRTSRGSSFGQAGYAKIARGSNACGIEGSMTVLDTESRRSKAGVNVRTMCPTAYPKYCQKTRTCKKSTQRCSPEIKQSSSASQYRPSGDSGSRPGPNYRPSGGTRPGPGIDQAEAHPAHTVATTLEMPGIKGM
ncbi:uncharacterized protein LOC134812591 [Bolinopsis microptera]|uniref:uncharacterized protein LOC134812591 n=1 Tax=Bolinopsis microptera TaxID=2820187 RepID=UPI0030794479